MTVTARLASLVLAPLFVLSACGGAAAPASPTSAAPPAPSVASSAAAKPAASVAASASAKPAASTAAQAGSGTPIRIGYITDLTGTTAAFGKDGVDGTNLYFDSVGNTVAGRKVEVIAVDDEIKPDVAVTKARQLVENNKVNIIIGVLNTAICYALAQWAKSAEEPLHITQGCSSQFYASDPRFASTYVSRSSIVPMALADPMAAWAYKQGYRKASLMTFDQVGGLEAADLFAAAFLKQGGSIVQEQHPPFPNNPDFGPYLAQLDQSADVMFTFEPGIDGLRFAQQFQNYTGAKKPRVLDMAGVVTDPSNLSQLKDAAVGIVGAQIADYTASSPDYQAMAKAWKAKYPDRPLSANAINAYASAQILAAVFQKVNGNVEDKQGLLNALYGIDVTTVRGPFKLDSNHEPIQNSYIYDTVKEQDGSIGYKNLESVPMVPQNGSFTFQQLQKLKPGTNKGKWPGFTKTQLDQLIGS
ncbi:MAG TPA: ABC transporter substrate-binding protein [Chloroflexota bacterium]|nr:ABC transporter substrate-binding protein [Chloroflexota bacterium]